MKQRLKRVLLLILGLLLAPGCVFMNVKIPLDTDLQDTELGSKVGVADTHAVLGLVAWGDSGMQAAAQDGDIQTLRHADREYLVILGIVYARQRTVVYGD